MREKTPEEWKTLGRLGDSLERQVRPIGMCCWRRIRSWRRTYAGSWQATPGDVENEPRNEIVALEASLERRQDRGVIFPMTPSWVDGADNVTQISAVCRKLGRRGQNCSMYARDRLRNSLVSLASCVLFLSGLLPAPLDWFMLNVRIRLPIRIGKWGRYGANRGRRAEATELSSADGLARRFDCEPFLLVAASCLRFS